MENQLLRDAVASAEAADRAKSGFMPRMRHGIRPPICRK